MTLVTLALHLTKRLVAFHKLLQPTAMSMLEALSRICLGNVYLDVHVPANLTLVLCTQMVLMWGVLHLKLMSSKVR